ncbi:MAG: T9SS type A sorting domain-containing protein [Flavobacterium lindanitolerans]|uniref:T9SS type A sorting domain-containing protein n=1 Tax=Flavobacterium lindanitolerans TaxID=428988 RepID=UPI001A404C0B|nr:T9SS type A sorting domain-containing protein [Flavobacterium lindanitolerans]MBL7866631.1 T9SS type A sorting domain-containing protein [Flavobacterium lindanitolerans]
MKTTITFFKACLFFMICLLSGVKSEAQTMNKGDIAFIGYNTGGQDGFAFIALNDLPAGQTLYFTEQGWSGTQWMNTLNEPHLAYVIPPGITCGKIISFVETAPDVITVTGGGSVTFALGTSFNLSGGDQIIAYQSASGVAPAAPIFISAIHGDYNSSKYDPVTTWNPATGSNSTLWATSDSAIPTDLENGVNCISLYPAPGPEFANAKYNGTLTGTSIALRAAINNPANWMHDNSTSTAIPIQPSNFPTPSVTCINCTNPTVPTLTASTAVLCNGSSRTITITGSLNSATAWHVYSGSCGGTLVTSTATGSFSVSPTTTTTYYVRGEGGCVTPGACATITVSVNPAIVLTTGGGSTNVSCNGGNNGTATVAPTGGTPPYTYSWAPSGGTAATATGLGVGVYTVTVTDANLCQATRNFTITQPPVLNGITVVTNVACFGGNTGAINLTPSGGTPPYTFNWGGGITTEDRTGLAAGNYSVTITDANSCTRTISNINVTQPAAVVSGTTVVTNVACFGGSTGAINLTPTGGVPPYTYNWVGGITTEDRSGLAAGTYSVTITDANGCTGTVSGITVTQPTAALGGTAIKTDVSCNGGSNGTATVSASGGTPPYTYSWAPSGGTNAMATGLAANTYTVTVTDNNGCQITRTVTVNQPAAALSGIISKTDVSCNGGNNGTATVTATGGTTPYSYSWSPSGGTNATATGLAAGTYTVTVTDFNGCQITRTATVNQPATALSAATGGGKTDVSCNGGSNGTATVAATGGTPPYSYSWAPSGGTNASATGLTAGTYTVTVTDFNGCQATRTYTINQPTALSAATGGGKTDVSCNGGANGTATVAPTGGTPPYTYSWAPSGGTAATASGLAVGTYTVTVTDNNNCQVTRTFTINQPTALSAATGGGKTDVSCNGGSNGTATVAPTGGTPPYTYSWSPSGGTAATATGLAVGTYTVTVTDSNNCQVTRTFTINQPTALSAATGSKTDASCNGGANGMATVTPTGGTPPYTYSWTPSGGTNATATGLAAGTYTVTVTDANNCQATRSFTINEPTALTATTSQTNTSCNGGTNGTASVTVSGGTPGYTYSWSPSGGTAATASGLAAGTYTVTITDANNCQITRNFTITEPAILSATTSQINVSCNGGTNGSATVTVTGGTGAYSYAWAPSGGTAATASGLAAGTYTVTAIDANTCQITTTVTITEPAVLSATTAQTNVLCNGGATGSATVTIAGGTGPYTYSWAPSGGTAATASGLATGIYTVTVTDANNCQLTRTFTITEPAVLSATTSQTNLSCNGGTNGIAGVTVTGGTAPYTYSWAPSGGTGATATGLAAGTYTVTITDANACQITRSFTITEPTALSATTSSTNVSCNGGSNGSATVTVTGGTGAYTYLWAPSGGTAATASGLAAGNYTVTITDANMCQITRTVSVTQPSPIVIVPSQSNVSCTGGSNGSATVGVSGGTGNYTFSWAPSGGTGATATGLAAGTYTVTVTDANSCTATQSFTITTTADTTPPTVVTTNITVPLTAGVATITAAQVNNGSTDNCGIASISVSPSTFNCSNVGPNTVTLTVTDNSGNTATGTATVTITDPTNFCGLSVPEFGDIKMRLYPNPTNGIVTVEFSRDITAEKIEVYSITGQLILSDTNTTTQSSRQFNMERFPSGVYLVKITTAQGTQVKRLMRE